MDRVDEKEQRLVEYSIEAVVIAWLSYLFLYQNYLLHNWHRGLPLPSKWPFILTGIGIGALFFWYEWRKLEKEFGRKTEVPSELFLPDANQEEP